MYIIKLNILKKITLLITLLTISVSFGQELITNGDFETGDTTGWYNTGANISASTVLPYEGTNRGNLGNEACSLRQDITVETNVEYTVDFWLRFNNDAATTFTYITIKDNADDSDIYTQTLPPLTATWSNVNFTFTSAAATDVRFDVYKFARSSVNPSSVNNSIAVDLVSIKPSVTASVDDLLKFNFKSYPNPATDMIYFSASKNIEKIEIYNVVGQKVESKILNNNQVNVSKLSKGIYIMKAFIGNAVGTYKFVKE